MKITRYISALAIGISVLLLNGCTTAPLNFSPTNIEFSTDNLDGDLRSVNVSIASEKEKTGDLEVGLFGNQYESSFRTTFKDALEEALTASGLFDPASNTKVSVFAKVLKFDSPPMGVNFTTDMEVQYKVQNLSTGQIVFLKNISSVGEVDGTYAFLGATRFTEARNRTVQNNISNFINELKNFIASQKSLEPNLQTNKTPMKNSKAI